MAENAAVKPELSIEPLSGPVKDQDPKLQTDIRAIKTKNLQARVSSLGALKISMPDISVKAARPDTDASLADQPALPEAEADASFSEDVKPAVSQPVAARKSFQQNLQQNLDQAPSQGTDLRSKTQDAALGFMPALTGTIVWVCVCVFYVATHAPLFALQNPVDLGAILAGAALPPILMWAVLIFASRRVVNIVAAQLSIESFGQARSDLNGELNQFFSLTKKAAMHVDRVTSSLSTRTENLAELVDRLDEKINAVQDRLSHSVKMIDAESGRLASGIDRIKDVADESLNKVGTLQGNFESIETLLSAFTPMLDGQNTKIADLAETIGEKTAQMTAAMDGTASRLDETANKALETVARQIEGLESQKALLKGEVESMQADMQGISDNMVASVSLLERTVESARKSSNELGGNFETGAKSMMQAVDQIQTHMKQAENLLSSAGTKLNGLIAQARDNAASLNGTITEATGALEASEERASHILQMASAHLESAAEHEKSQAQHLAALGLVIGDNQRKSEEIAHTTRNHLNALSQTLEQQKNRFDVLGSTFIEVTDRLNGSLADSLAQISTISAQAEERQNHMQAHLSRRVSEWGDHFEKMTGRAGELRAHLQDQTQQITQLISTVDQNAKALDQKVVDQKDALKAHAEETLSQFADVIKNVDAALEKTGRLTTQSLRDFKNIDSEIGQKSTRIQSAIESAAQVVSGSLDALDERIALSVDKLVAQGASAETAMGVLSQNLKDAGESAETIYTQSIDHAHIVKTRYNELNNKMEDVAETHLSKLLRMGIVFDDSLEKMKAGAAQANTLVHSATDELAERMRNVDIALKNTTDRLRSLSVSLEKQPSDIHLIADQALLKIETTQRSFSEYLSDFSAAIHEGVVRLQNAGEEFSSQSRNIRAESGKSVLSLEATCGKMAEQSQAFARHAEEVQVKARASMQGIEGQSRLLLEQAGAALRDIMNVADGFDMQSTQLNENLKSTLHLTESYGTEVHRQAMEAAEISTQAIEQIEKSVTVLQGTIKTLGESGASIAGQIDIVQEKLAADSERFLHVTAASMESAREASAVFGKQSEALFKASNDVVKLVDVIRKSGADVQRSAFLSSAKFIVESLYSLSVDVARMLDGDLSEKTWKSFEKGDVLAFTRRLLQIGTDKIQLEKGARKFKEDSEFRTFVQRYIRQFEELFEQARAHDHGALLTATIGSSEIAKLYEILCRLAEKPCLIGKETARAA